MRPRFPVWLAGLLMAGPALADPYVFNVGADGPEQCSTTSLQEAVDMAREHEGFDIIHIANNMSYSAQQVVIREGDEFEQLQIVGGYTSCEASNNFETPLGRTTLSGLGGDLAPVIAIANDAHVDVELRQLTITRGDAVAGGGISFNGHGYLTLVDTAVLANAAARAGGIYFRSRSGAAVLELKSDTVISGNVSGGDGGGIYLDGTSEHQVTMYAWEPRVTIKDNRAPDGRGGGMFAHGRVAADLRSTGFGSPQTALFADNSARDGGGLAVKADTDTLPSHGVVVTLRAPNDSQAMHFHGNVATERGGALFIQGDYDATDIASARVEVRDFLFTDNRAADGSVAYVSEGGYGNLLELRTGDCRHYPCHRMERNVTTGGGGSMIRVRGDGAFKSDRPVIAYNEGSHILRVDGHHGSTSSPGAQLSNCLIVRNTMSGSLFHMNGSGGLLSFFDCTIADNETTQVFNFENASDRFELKNSIVSETAPLLFTRDLATPVTTANNVLSAASAIGPFDQTSVVAPANFLDRSVGDYNLKPGSRAVDFAPKGGAQQDLLFGWREIDFAMKVDGGTPRDVGALEYRAASSELVMNNDVAGDLRAWEAVPVGNAASVIARDAEGAPSGSGTGSLLATLPADAPAGDHVVARQCIPLPIGGGFRLDGWANSAPVGDAAPDRAMVRVKLRTAASDCNAGAPVVAIDEAVFPYGGWQTLGARGFNAAVNVQPDWSASLEMELVVRRHAARVGSNASVVRFDLLTLVPAQLPDSVFRDGYE